MLPAATVDWEAELVVVIGRRAERVTAAEAWSHVAGLTTGQDYSERALQLTGPAPQFSLGKSFGLTVSPAGLVLWSYSTVRGVGMPFATGLVTDLDPAVPGPISPFGRPLLREWLFTT